MRVAIRVRPLSEREQARGDREVWMCGEENTLGVQEGGGFKPKHRFDLVYPPGTSTQQIHEEVATPLVDSVLSGLNATVFAYGVTSSGKTHTMMGCDADPGLVPRTIMDLFTAAAERNFSVFLVKLSMMEIYNEVVNDLVNVGQGQIQIRDDGNGGGRVLLEGLSETPVASAQAALAIINKAELNRRVDSTAFNDQSSRSHIIIRLAIECSEAAPSGGRLPSRTLSYFNLIDLAGSESARAATNKGQRMEGSFINTSLLTLGTVIQKLAEGKSGHVPFRDSKLTRLLQSSLSGTGAQVAIVCNITPSSAQAQETYNTLMFAERANRVKINVMRNTVVDDKAIIRHLQVEVKRLQGLLAGSSTETKSATSVEPSSLINTTSTEVDGGVQGEDPSRVASVTTNTSYELEHLRWQHDMDKQELQRARDTVANMQDRFTRITLTLVRVSKMLVGVPAGKGRRLVRSLSTNTPFRLEAEVGGEAAAGDGPASHENSRASVATSSSLEEVGLHLRNPSWGTVWEPSRSTGTGESCSLELPTLRPDESMPGRQSTTPTLLHGKEDTTLDLRALGSHLEVLTQELAEKEEEIQELRQQTQGLAYDRDMHMQLLYADRIMLQDDLTATTSKLKAIKQECREWMETAQQLCKKAEELAAQNEELLQERARYRQGEGSLLTAPLDTGSSPRPLEGGRTGRVSLGPLSSSLEPGTRRIPSKSDAGVTSLRPLFIPSSPPLSSTSNTPTPFSRQTVITTGGSRPSRIPSLNPSPCPASHSRPPSAIPSPMISRENSLDSITERMLGSPCPERLASRTSQGIPRLSLEKEQLPMTPARNRLSSSSIPSISQIPYVVGAEVKASSTRPQEPHGVPLRAIHSNPDDVHSPSWALREISFRSTAG